jgi:hypothetical protein
MRILRSINPLNGYMREFPLKDDEPILLGTLSLERVLRNLNVILDNVPGVLKKRIVEYIGRARHSIEMGNCKIDYKYISWAHCMIFPEQNPQIVDLFSKNGTRIAGLAGGVPLDPGRKTDLKSDDIILLAAVRAVFQYHESQAMESALFKKAEIVNANGKNIRQVHVPPPFGFNPLDDMHSEQDLV